MEAKPIKCTEQSGSFQPGQDVGVERGYQSALIRRRFKGLSINRSRAWNDDGGCSFRRKSLNLKEHTPIHVLTCTSIVHSAHDRDTPFYASDEVET